MVEGKTMPMPDLQRPMFDDLHQVGPPRLHSTLPETTLYLPVCMERRAVEKKPSPAGREIWVYEMT
jgi:hypothetical protein